MELNLFARCLARQWICSAVAEHLGVYNHYTFPIPELYPVQVSSHRVGLAYLETCVFSLL